MRVGSAKVDLKNNWEGLPCWSSGWDFAFQCGMCEFDPCSRSEDSHMALGQKNQTIETIL